MAASDQYYAYAYLVQRALEQGGPVERVTMPIRREPPNTARTLFSFNVADIPSGVDLGIIELVTNDISRTPFEKYRARYLEFIRTFRERNPSATLVCVGAWTFSNGPGDRFDNAAKEACQNYGGRFVAIDKYFDDRRNRGPESNKSAFGADDFHPNNLGSMRIATDVLVQLKGFYPGAES